MEDNTICWVIWWLFAFLVVVPRDGTQDFFDLRCEGGCIILKFSMRVWKFGDRLSGLSLKGSGLLWLDRLVSVIVLFACFALALTTGSVSFLPRDSQAVDGLGLVGPLPAVAASLVEGVASLDVTPTPSGMTVFASHELAVTTNSPVGYELAVSAEVEDGGLVASEGTVDVPVPLANNTWGFAVDGVRNPTSENGVPNGFDESYDILQPNSSALWAGVPDEPVVFKQKGNPAEDDRTTVYYGLRADMAVPAGNFQRVVTYSAVVGNIIQLPVPTVVPTPTHVPITPPGPAPWRRGRTRR